MPYAECLSVELSIPVLTPYLCRGLFVFTLISRMRGERFTETGMGQTRFEFSLFKANPSIYNCTNQQHLYKQRAQRNEILCDGSRLRRGSKTQERFRVLENFM